MIRTFQLLAGVVIVAIVEIVRHFLGDGYDFAMFPCALFALLGVWAFIKVRVDHDHRDQGL